MQRAKRAMADPEIQQILNTPEVRNALADLQNNPSAIQGIMSNPSLAAKIEKLIQAGVIGTGWLGDCWSVYRLQNKCYLCLICINCL